MQSTVETPTLTFPTPSLRPQQQTPTLTGPAVLQPQSPRPAALQAAANAVRPFPQADATPSRAASKSPGLCALPSAHAPQPEALPSSPVHGVWNRSLHASTAAQAKLAGAPSGSHAEGSVSSSIADSAADCLPEAQQLPGRLTGQADLWARQEQQGVFDHRSLTAPAEHQSAALLTVSGTSCYHAMASTALLALTTTCCNVQAMGFVCRKL